MAPQRAVTATMAGTAAGFAHAREPGGTHAITTVDSKINYFRPVVSGTSCARARVLRIGKVVCVVAIDRTPPLIAPRR